MTGRQDGETLAPGGFTPQQGSGGEALTPTGFQPLDPGQRPERGPLWPKLALAAAVALVGAVLFFLLTARSLEIQVDAVGEATVTIQGLSVPLGQRYLIRPGEYPVTVTVPGYRDWQQVVSVTDADSQQVRVAPSILPGRVSVTSEPSGATVTVAGAIIGH